MLRALICIFVIRVSIQLFKESKGSFSVALGHVDLVGHQMQHALRAKVDLPLGGIGKSIGIGNLSNNNYGLSRALYLPGVYCWKREKDLGGISGRDRSPRVSFPASNGWVGIIEHVVRLGEFENRFMRDQCNWAGWDTANVGYWHSDRSMGEIDYGGFSNNVGSFRYVERDIGSLGGTLRRTGGTFYLINLELQLPNGITDSTVYLCSAPRKALRGSSDPVSGADNSVNLLRSGGVAIAGVHCLRYSGESDDCGQHHIKTPYAANPLKKLAYEVVFWCLGICGFWVGIAMLIYDDMGTSFRRRIAYGIGGFIIGIVWAAMAGGIGHV